MAGTKVCENFNEINNANISVIRLTVTIASRYIYTRALSKLRLELVRAPYGLDQPFKNVVLITQNSCFTLQHRLLCLSEIIKCIMSSVIKYYRYLQSILQASSVP